MITTLAPGKCLRRLVQVDGVEYVLEVCAGGVLMRRRRSRTPWAVLPFAHVLELGRANVLRELGRRKRRRSAPRAPKRRRKASRRRV